MQRFGKIGVVLCLLVRAVLAQPADPALMGKEIDSLLNEYRAKGKKPFETRWPGGSLKEKLEADKVGNVNYTLFFPTGGYAVRYQDKPGTVTKLERYYGNGKTHILINQDPRIIDYTSYWENGNKKAKYQKNLQTKQVFYDARDAEGNPIYPRPKP